LNLALPLCNAWRNSHHCGEQSPEHNFRLGCQLPSSRTLSRTSPKGRNQLFGARRRMTAPVQVSRTPASQNHPRAPTTGVREAPRHEIAGRKGLGSAAAIYGDLRSASVCFREAGTTDARQFDGLTGRGERAPPALGSVSAWRRRSQDVGAASSSERRRRWLTVSSKNGKNGRRCVAVDNAISIMTYRS
jgi:hypothetical protein